MSVSAELIKNIPDGEPLKVPVEQYLNDVTYYADHPNMRALVGSLLDETTVAHPTVQDYCFISNEIGAKLTARGHHQVAAECHYYAFADENPYSQHIAIYASNTVDAAKSYIDSHGDDIPMEVGTWLIAHKRPLREVLDCVTHFRNLTIYQEGYENPSGNDNGKVAFRDGPLKDKVNFLGVSEKAGQELFRLIKALETPKASS